MQPDERLAGFKGVRNAYLERSIMNWVVFLIPISAIVMSLGIGMLHLSPTLYFNETQHAIHLMDIAVGIFKAGIFGVLIALSGCLRGMQCGRSASAVGLAATSAVVTGIVFIIATDGVFAVITNILKI